MKKKKKPKQYFVAITVRHKMNSGFCAIYRVHKYIFVNMKKNPDYVQLLRKLLTIVHFNLSTFLICL